MFRDRHFRPQLEGLEHRLTPSANSLGEGATEAPPDDTPAETVLVETGESLTISDSTVSGESELPPVIVNGEPLASDIAEPTYPDLQGYYFDEVFLPQDPAADGLMEPLSDGSRDIVFTDPNDASPPLHDSGGDLVNHAEAIDFVLASP